MCKLRMGRAMLSHRDFCQYWCCLFQEEVCQYKFEVNQLVLVHTEFIRDRSHYPNNIMSCLYIESEFTVLKNDGW